MKVVHSSIKYYWKDDILSVLKLNSNKYSLLEIENKLVSMYSSTKDTNPKKSHKKNMCITYDKHLWNTLNYSSYRCKLRISIVMNSITKFIINNDRPKTKFFSSDFDFHQLNNDEINSILNNL